jgi:hypothetical protein
MSFFNTNEPLIRPKQSALDIQDLCGLLQIRLQLGGRELFSLLYTRIDQIFVFWGWMTALIFLIAQFVPMSWQTLAIVSSGLTLFGVGVMGILAWFWVRVEQVRWIVYIWAGLMMVGVGLTDAGIFLGWGQVLMNLCPLWLGLSALGYAITGWGLRSRTFFLAALLHLLGITWLPYSGPWPFAITGLVIAGTLLFLAEVQWDMRPPSAVAILSEAEQQFNHEQYQRRLAGKGSA